MNQTAMKAIETLVNTDRMKLEDALWLMRQIGFDEGQRAEALHAERAIGGGSE